MSYGGGCSEKLKNGKFNTAWSWYFSEIGQHKEALGEMKNQSLGDSHKKKEECFETAPDGSEKKKLLEEYHKLKQQKLKLSRGPKAALKRLKNKSRKVISKAHMKMDKTIKNGKSKLSLTGSCIKTPGTKICKRDANGEIVYKPGRRPPSFYLKNKFRREKKNKLKQDPLKTVNRRFEKIALRKSINNSKTEKTSGATGFPKRSRILKTVKSIGKGIAYSAPKALGEKIYRGYKGIDKQTYQTNKLREKAKRLATRNERKEMKKRESELKSLESEKKKRSPLDILLKRKKKENANKMLEINQKIEQKKNKFNHIKKN